MIAALSSHDSPSIELPSDVDELPSDIDDDNIEVHTAQGASQKRASDKPLATAMKKPAKAPRPYFPDNKKFVLQLPGEPHMPRWLRQHLLSLPPSGRQPRQKDNFMEVFSRPRIMPFITSMGMRGIRSMDVVTGWDLLQKDHIKNAFTEIHDREPYCIMLSPPCTVFSGLMNANWGNMKPEKAKTLAEDGISLLDVSVWMANFQMDNGRKFIIEHPARAQSWNRPNLQALGGKPGVSRSTFDMCQYGLKTMDGKKFHQKRTALLSNVPTVHAAFNANYCTHEHEHAVIEGSRDGVRCSLWAQVYPDQLCSKIAECTKSQMLQDGVP